MHTEPRISRTTIAQAPARSFFGWRHLNALFVTLLGSQPSLHSALMVVPFGWQPSSRNKKIPLSVLSAVDGTTMANAFLSMTRPKLFPSMKKKVWRAVLRVVGDKDRKFGSYSEDPVVTAENLLESMGFRVGMDEQDRVLKIVKDLCGTTSHGSQPSKSPCVAIIHQIYGLFRDGKAMPKLFATSQMRWR